MVYLMLANGFEELEAITIIDLFRRANIQIKTVSIMDDLEVFGSKGIGVIADSMFKNIEFEKGEMIVFPGGMPGTTNLCNFGPLREIIEYYYKEGRYVAAICAAPMVLAQAGILKRRDATIYPGMESELIDAKATAGNVVISDNVITSKGPGTAIDFSLELIKILRGEETSRKVKEEILY